MNPPHFHFLGICGTAMGAVASAMVRKGYTVTGSDANVYPPMSSFLEKAGIKIFEGYKAENIPDDADHLIIGNAISRGNPEAEAILDRKLKYLSLPETMKEFFLIGKRNFVVTGTHGKTTTTSLLTWLMEDSRLNPSFMIGGIALNLGCGGRFTDSTFTVLEGDEYDTAFFDKRSKFLHYLPEVVVINNIEFDHADIFNNIAEIKLSFRRLLQVVPRNGLALINGDDPNCVEVTESSPCPVRKVGFGEKCEIRIEKVEYTPEGSFFSLGKSRFFIPMIGEFNIRNAAMSVAAARFAGIQDDAIAASMLKFAGVARRQELKGEANGIKVIDDFAHHPTAIGLAIDGLRQRYPQNRLWVIFEPRSNTTIRDIFQKELAIAMAKADIAVVATIKDHKKLLDTQLLNEGKLVADIAEAGTEAYLGTKVDEIINLVSEKAHSGDVIAVMSNGGFEGIHGKLLAKLGE